MGPASAKRDVPVALGGELPREAARRVFEPQLVSQPGRRQGQELALAGRVQRRATAQQSGLSHAQRVRRKR